MPRERRDRSASHDRSNVSPYQFSSSTRRRSSLKDPLELGEIAKEREEARYPVCMEHPHNGVLLVCSSHEKGVVPACVTQATAIQIVSTSFGSPLRRKTQQQGYL